MTDERKIESETMKFLQKVYSRAFDDAEVDAVFEIVAKMNQSYHETCRRVNADAEKYI